MESINKDQITGVILAGGQARRMGGIDKGLARFGDKPLIEHVMARLQPQVSNLIINANRSLETYRKYHFPVVCDQLNNYQGPLAGMAAALEQTKTDAAVFVPCDAPLLPDFFVKRLCTVMNQHQTPIVCASDGQRLQPVHALIKTSMLNDLYSFLENGGRKIDLWYQQHAFQQADFSDSAETFTNANTIEDLQRLSK